MIRAVILDFGGVIAEEGFREGMKAIAVKHGLDPEIFFMTADSLIYETGYVKGGTDEKTFWSILKQRTGIKGDESELREEILRRFILRRGILDFIDSLREKKIITAILSDQTNWLEEVNERSPFFIHFDHVFNSYRIGRGKRDPGTFRYICSLIGVRPDEALFIDDNIRNIENAEKEGLSTILFTDIEDMRERVNSIMSASGRNEEDLS